MTARMFHAAPQSARQSILRHGLDPERGERMWPDKTYQRAIYLHADWASAYHRACEHEIVVPGYEHNTRPMDIWQVDTTGLDLPADPLLDSVGHAGAHMSTARIEAARLKLIENWRQRGPGGP